MKNDDLIYAYLDGTISDAELKLMKELMAKDEDFCYRLARASRQQVLLFDEFNEINMFKTLKSLRTNSKKSVLHLRKFAAIAAAAFIILSAGIWLISENEAVTLTCGNNIRKIPVVSLLDNPVTVNSSESSLLVFPDNTQARLSENSMAELINSEKGWLLHLKKGTVSCEVAKQINNRQFTVLTQRLRVTVIGTRFNVSTSEKQTDVHVTQGTVQVAENNQRKYTLQANERFTVQQTKTGSIERTLTELVWNVNPSTKGLSLYYKVGSIDKTKSGDLIFKSGISKDDCLALDFDYSENAFFEYDSDLFLEYEYKLSNNKSWMGFWIREIKAKYAYYFQIKPEFGKWNRARFSLDSMMPKQPNSPPLKKGDKISKVMILTDDLVSGDYFEIRELSVWKRKTLSK